MLHVCNVREVKPASLASQSLSQIKRKKERKKKPMVLENTRTLTSSLHTHMCTHMPIHAHTHTLALFSLKTTLLFRNVLQWLLESWKTFCPNTHCCIFMVKFPSQHTKDQVNIQHTRPLFSAKTKK